MKKKTHTPPPILKKTINLYIFIHFIRYFMTYDIIICNKGVDHMRHIVLGPEGTFTDLAYQKLKTNDFAGIYVDTIEQVFRHRTADDYGILPIENTLEGYIQPTLDGILKHRL